VMDFKDMLRIAGIDPDAKDNVILLRHRPYEPKLARVMPWLISERPDLFEAFQSVLGRPERTAVRANFLASFLGLNPGTAHFIGLYRIAGHRPLEYKPYWEIPQHKELREFGYNGFTEEQAAEVASWLQFTFEPLEAYAHWRGRLVIDFPPPERVWCRLVHKGRFPVRAILEESAFAASRK